MKEIDYEFNEFHTFTKEKTIDFLGTDQLKGLDENECSNRLKIIGENTLGNDAKIDYKAIVIHQLCNAMILVLLISMVISFAIKDWITGGVIAFVIGLNVSIGIFQEYRASKTMNSLKALSSPTAQVIRNGMTQTIQSKDVVVGDLVTVKLGDTLPADLRLISENNFETDEALLTGEAMPVTKDCEKLYSTSIDIPIGDRLNLAFSSSTVVKGRAEGIVIKTGLNTEIGKIAKSLRNKNPLISRDKENSFFKNVYLTLKQTCGAFLGTTVGTPLHRKLSKLAILLFFIAVIFAIIVMASQKFNVDKGVAIYAVCVALSMIPSSLVVVLTITMSVGATVMVKRNVIVRKLDSLEALGAITDICSDKTGTLTQGKMVVKKVWVPKFGTLLVHDSDDPINPLTGNVDLIPNVSPFEYKHSDTLYDPQIIQNFKDKFISNENFNSIEIFNEWLETATLANIAHVFKDIDNWKAHGDPTEVAIQVFTTKMNLPRHKLTGETSHSKDKSFIEEGEMISESDDDDQIRKKNQNNEIQYDVGTKYTADDDEESFSSNEEKLPDNIEYKHFVEYPFDSTIKRMSTVFFNIPTETYNVYSKGAFESILNCCSTKYDGSDDDDNLKKTELTEKDKEIIKKNVNSISSEGLRVLAFATKTFSYEMINKDTLNKIKNERDYVEKDLTFLGLVGIYDAPRPETAGAVKKFHNAGINVRMLTGDFPGTAKAIAQEVGILPTNLYHYPKEVIDIMIVTGAQFDKMTDEQIDALPVLPLVVARCAPQTKVRMVEALHRRNKFCAMTGDGVNDSPSLKMANVGIAMGLNGSDVAKDASDIVLSDDNFASILNAVEEGRRMNDNIQKFVLQLLAGNIAQALYLIIGLVFMDEENKAVFPLSPVEVLWIIVFTSCLPAMGLGIEKAAPDLMDRAPNDSRHGIFTWEIICDMNVYGLLMASCCMGAFTAVLYGLGGELGYNCNNNYNDTCNDVFKARSTAFATMTWCCLLLAWEVVSLRRSLFRMQPETDEPIKQFFRDIWGNQVLFWSIILGIIITFPVVYIPVINKKVFFHKGIGWEWGVAVGMTFAFLLTAEMYKYFKRWYYRNKGRAQNPEKDLENSTKKDPFEAYSSSTTLVTESLYPL